MLLNRKVRNYSRLTNNVEWYSHHIKKISVNMVITKLNIHNMYEDMLTIQRLFPKNRLTKIELIKVSNNNPLYSLDGLERDFVKEFYSTVGKFNTTTQFKFNLEKSNVFREKLLVNQFLLPIWYSLDSNQWYLVEERKFQLDDIESQYQDEMNRISSKLNRFISEIEGKEYINPYDYLF
ncbi:MAG: hypothetical protein GX180_12975 [Enterococcus sp.]|nr:hypothetical protein [Enterococcus sp.]